MAKLSSLKIKMGQMQYEKQRKEHKIEALKVGPLAGLPLAVQTGFSFCVAVFL